MLGVNETKWVRAEWTRSGGWAGVWAERTGSDSRQGAKKEKRELRRAVWIEDLGDEGE